MQITNKQKKQTALVSVPWAIFNRPSIQLGTLKAHTEQSSEIEVVCFHPYLNVAKGIGVDGYQKIADSGWAGEALFSALLFPEMKESARKLFIKSIPDRKHLPSFEKLLETINKICDTWADSPDWSAFLSIGFSVCFNQLLGSLYLAKKLKQCSGCPPIIFGGSSCSGPLGESLVNTFEYIDFVIDGEGEFPYAALCRFLENNQNDFPGRVLRQQKSVPTIPLPEIKELDTLLPPDYRPYFKEVDTLFPNQPFIPVIPVEFSRGCWWNKCTFCNLNLQWKRYRYKHAEKLYQELRELSTRHHCLDFVFTDNALPPQETGIFAKLLENTPVDFRFFAEIRAKTSQEELKIFQRIGIHSIQVGIEALSPRLLEKFDKGVSVIDNVAIMKRAMEYKIALDGNLIIEFPGSTEADIRETIENINFILPFKPLQAATFFLGYGSIVYRFPERFGIKALIGHQKTGMLFPQSILNQLQLLVNSYRGDKTIQKKLWRPVVKELACWQAFHENRSKNHYCPLTFRDGSDFIIIRQERPGTTTLHHRLYGTSRKIYLFCSEIRTLDEIKTEFTGFQTQALMHFLEELVNKYLMFKEKNKYLALAVHDS